MVAQLQRIRQVDERIHAFTFVDADASPANTGRLAGLSLAVKDTMPVAGMPWTSGSVRWRDRIATEDALPVYNARSAGAGFIGKTNTPELAAAVGTHNELFPPTQNPWRHGITPGGSSGGSAAAVAAGMCAIAFGDDYGGSIRIPAACCGTVGLRPSFGRVPDEEIDPGGLNARGPLTRTVGDARLAFEVMAWGSASLTPSQQPSAAKRSRLGVVVASDLPMHASGWDACARAAGVLQDSGHALEPCEWKAGAVVEGYRVVRRFSLARVPGQPEEYGKAVRGLIEEGRRLTAADFYQAHRLSTLVRRPTIGGPSHWPTRCDPIPYARA